MSQRLTAEITNGIIEPPHLGDKRGEARTSPKVTIYWLIKMSRIILMTLTNNPCFLFTAKTSIPSHCKIQDSKLKISSSGYIICGLILQI